MTVLSGLHRFFSLLTDGQRVANTTLIDTLLSHDFQLIINDEVYDVKSPERGKKRQFPLSPRPTVADFLFSRSVVSFIPVCVSSEHAADLGDVKHIVHLLHTAIHQPEHHLLKERQLLERLDNLKQQLSPMEKVSPQVLKAARACVR